MLVKCTCVEGNSPLHAGLVGVLQGGPSARVKKLQTVSLSSSHAVEFHISNVCAGFVSLLPTHHHH